MASVPDPLGVRGTSVAPKVDGPISAQPVPFGHERRYEFSPERLVCIRHGTRLSQVGFARLLNVSVKTLRNWEQGRRRPTAAAVSLLRIVDRDQPLALRALRLPMAWRAAVPELVIEVED